MNDFNLSDAWEDAISQLRTDHCSDEILNLHRGGYITSSEVFNAIWEHCSKNMDALKAVMQPMTNHKEEWVREIAVRIQELLKRSENQITDITEILKTSPLQPGVRIRLEGSYDGGDWWLNGNEYYGATFLRFVSRGPDAMPVAFIQLDREIHMTEAAGLLHHGKNAVLNLLFVANWDATERVTVHIVDDFPDDVADFYESHPFCTKEIETHASYRIETIPES